jgi:cytochrome c oxidase subunit 2
MRSTRGEFQRLFWHLYLPITAAAVLIVLGATLLLVLRYHGDRRASTSSSNRLVELVGIGVLATIVVVLLTATYSAEGNDDSLHPAAVVVRSIAYQWGWTFSYDRSRVSLSSSPDRPPTLVLPAGETIEVRLRSRDVIHSFWVPEQRFKRLAFPDHETRFDLRFDQTGRFEGRCATFCGVRHRQMAFVVDVVPRAAFERWLHAQEVGT